MKINIEGPHSKLPGRFSFGPYGPNIIKIKLKYFSQQWLTV